MIGAAESDSTARPGWEPGHLAQEARVQPDETSPDVLSPRVQAAKDSLESLVGGALYAPEVDQLIEIEQRMVAEGNLYGSILDYANGETE